MAEIPKPDDLPDDLPALEVNDSSLPGTWCYYRPFNIGRLVSDEFTFAADRSFVWRTLEISKNDDVCLRRIEGAWSLDGNELKLNIKKQEVPNESFRKRVHFSVRMRLSEGQRELVLQSTRFDDDDHAGEHRLWLFPTEAAPGDAEKNISAYQEKRKQKIILGGPFKNLVSLLGKAVPVAVGQLQIPDPVFCVRLFYYDTHAPREGYCCWASCLTEPMRQRVLRAEKPHNVPCQLWDVANSFPEPGNGIYAADLTSNVELTEVLAQIYELLCESEDENVPKLRAALRSVSLMLQMVKWPETVRRTDDFVVFPADGSNYFASDHQEDMKASIPAKRLELLIQRGYLIQD